jgi:hypothetical protein
MRFFGLPSRLFGNSDQLRMRFPTKSIVFLVKQNVCKIKEGMYSLTKYELIYYSLKNSNNHCQTSIQKVLQLNLCQRLFFFASTNPQYEDRLFIELRVQYMKIACSEHVVYTNCFLFLFFHLDQLMYATCSELEIFMY